LVFIWVFLYWNLIGRSRVEDQKEERRKQQPNTSPDAGPDATLLNHYVRFRQSLARPVTRRQFSWTSDRTLDRTRRFDHCVRSRTAPARTVTRNRFPGGPLTGICPRPITTNRTCPVMPGAYWTLTGRLCNASGQLISASGHPVKSRSEPCFNRSSVFFLVFFFSRAAAHQLLALTLAPPCSSVRTHAPSSCSLTASVQRRASPLQSCHRSSTAAQLRHRLSS
jgi:hypothetical protein